MKKYENLTLNNQLCFALYSATHAITRTYRDALNKVGLTYTQYLVLLVLLEENRLSVGKIANKLKLDSATLTPLLKRIESAGLITRKRNMTDERIVELELTEKGFGLQHEISQIQKGVQCKTTLNKDEFETLKHSLDLLTEILEEPKKSKQKN